MDSEQFFQELHARIEKYDLLCHPYYKAWSAGQLRGENLREYARDYYPHVQAFPTYLAELAIRLEDGELRRAVLGNLADEKGWMDGAGKPSVPHSELWLDFAEGMGARRNLRGHEPVSEIKELIQLFHRLASEGSAAEALAAFYVYESQVPRVAKEKERGLRELYGADDKARAYFTLHTTADVHHSQVWRQHLEKLVEGDPEAAEQALAAGEKAARALWRALDGIEARRMPVVA